MKAAIAAILGVATLPRLVAAPDAAAINPLSLEALAKMTGNFWRQGCPASLDDLAVIEVTFGAIVIHRQLAPEVTDIFDQLSCREIRNCDSSATVAPWENYGPRLYAERNVTTGFYCETAWDDPDE